MHYESARDKLLKIEDSWEKYKFFLKEKYPPKEGKNFEFTCPHHREIDEIIHTDI